MRNSRVLIIGVLAVACGLVGAFVVARVAAPGEPEPMVEVLIAPKSITSTAQLKIEDFKVDKMPASKVEGWVLAAPGSPLSFDTVAKGKYLRATLGAGRALMVSDIYNAKEDPMRGSLKKGEVAKTIRVDPISSVAGFVQPGHHVDIEATTPVDAGAGPKPYTQIILQNVEVLATNESTAPSQDAPSKPADKVTLRLNREQALLLGAYQDSNTSMRLLLRPQADTDRYDIDGRFAVSKIGATNTASGTRKIWWAPIRLRRRRMSKTRPSRRLSRRYRRPAAGRCLLRPVGILRRNS